jgi:acid phosphatase family membrane protein YuiD
VIFIPIIAWFVAQVLKFLLYLLVERKVRFERFFGDGGMPSAHSATVSALVIMCGWSAGVGSAVFAVSLVFAIIVMHDATGVRREAGKQATAVKQLADVFNAMFLEKDEAIRTEKLKEFIGHTPLQVFFGSIVGIVVAIICIAILNLPYAGIII